jgi:hypothetical protein
LTAIIAARLRLRFSGLSQPFFTPGLKEKSR